ncbi:hypothetical protein C8J57DRAFT_1236055 [Mycena rebaudengoi]|nr:hypothetical protein C8J57DRAFT_1236055 [Mycena rebaudengoi]
MCQWQEAKGLRGGPGSSELQNVPITETGVQPKGRLRLRHDEGHFFFHPEISSGESYILRDNGHRHHQKHVRKSREKVTTNCAISDLRPFGHLGLPRWEPTPVRHERQRAAGEMVPIRSLKEEGDLQSGYLVLDMEEIGTNLDSQSSPTAPPVNAKAPTSCRPANVTAGELAMPEAQVKLGALFLIRFSCVYDSPPGVWGRAPTSCRPAVESATQTCGKHLSKKHQINGPDFCTQAGDSKHPQNELPTPGTSPLQDRKQLVHDSLDLENIWRLVGELHWKADELREHVQQQGATIRYEGAMERSAQIADQLLCDIYALWGLVEGKRRGHGD